VIGPADLLHRSSAPQFKNFQVFLISCPKRPGLSTIQTMNQIKHFTIFFLKFKSSVLVKRVFLSLNAAFAMAILDLISHVHLPSFVKTQPNYLIHSSFCSGFWSIIIFTGDG
jgi:hypothetical protein